MESPSRTRPSTTQNRPEPSDAWQIILAFSEPYTRPYTSVWRHHVPWDIGVPVKCSYRYSLFHVMSLFERSEAGGLGGTPRKTSAVVIGRYETARPEGVRPARVTRPDSAMIGHMPPSNPAGWPGLAAFISCTKGSVPAGHGLALSSPVWASWWCAVPRRAAGGWPAWTKKKRTLVALLPLQLTRAFQPSCPHMRVRDVT